MAQKRRATLRTIAEMAFVLRALVDAIEATGNRNVSAHRAALDLAHAHARGEAASKAALAGARLALEKACARYANASRLGPAQAALYAVPMTSLLWMVESAEDCRADLLARAARAVVGADEDAGRARVDELCREASERAAGVDDEPLPRQGSAAVAEVDARAQAAERALLERARTALAGEARALFDELRPARDAALTTRRAALVKLLRETGAPASEAVLAFEETFGGLLLPVSGDADFRSTQRYTTIGPWAVISSGYRWRAGARGEAGEDRLVPVAYGLQDDVYLLDERGAPWYHDPTGHAVALPFGADGAELVARLAMAAFTYASQEPQGTPLWPPVDHATRAAASLGLARLFADDLSAWWWGPAATVVVLQGRVYALARTEAAVAALTP